MNSHHLLPLVTGNLTAPIFNDSMLNVVSALAFSFEIEKKMRALTFC